jgi:glutamate synthase domain-containing protein 2/CDGSH-type Zn-finger protein
MKKVQKPRLRCLKNGPYVVKGLATFTGIDGRPIPVKPTLALCRCGRSETKPLCDGAHAQAGFKDEKDEGRVPDRRESYAGAAVTIHDNRGICSHAGFCTDKLPKVFRGGVEPWIDPDAAPTEDVTRVVGMCPSGALAHSVAGVEHGDQEREAAIRVSPHGPYRLEGGVELEGVESLEGASAEHRTLCRCGHSRNKPFCDGRHWHVGFRDDGRRRVALAAELEDRKPISVEVEGVELLVVKVDGSISVFQARCVHQGANMADGSIEGDKLVCGLHGWAYDLATGRKVGPGNAGLRRFDVWVDERWGEVLVSLEQVRAHAKTGPETPADGGPEPTNANREEPHNDYIQQLAAHGLARVGPHGPSAAMGVPRYELPAWDDLQILTAQLHRLPLLEETPVGVKLVVGPRARKPLELGIPIFVSDMSFGALSLEAKVALAKGAELAGTGICSGEGGMLPEEQAANSRYFYELASARFGFSWELLDKVQAFHFKGGQGAKTGTGGHLPAEKVTEKIAAVRGLPPGVAAVSPPRFPDWSSTDDYRRFADEVRERTGGIPIGFKLSAQHLEQDLDAAIRVGVDYVILDGRGGGTGAAPLIFRDHISVPTLPALARARKHLDESGNADITLIITGGLRTPADFLKALALGADGVAIANSAIQAIGCLGTRACHTNNCPAGIATQKEHLRKRIDVEEAARRLERFLLASVQLMSVLCRACGHDRLAELSPSDLTTWKRDVAYLTGVPYAGYVPLASAGPRP